MDKEYTYGLMMDMLNVPIDPANPGPGIAEKSARWRYSVDLSIIEALDISEDEKVEMIHKASRMRDQ